MTAKPAFALLCACLLIGCRSPSSQDQDCPPQTGMLDPAGKVFWQRMHYPYYASSARRHRIERGWGKLKLGMTESQVLALLGPPDVKASFAGYPPTVPAFESWDYFYRLKRPLGPDYHGDIFNLDLYEGDPRTVKTFTPIGFRLDPR